MSADNARAEVELYRVIERVVVDKRGVTLLGLSDEITDAVLEWQASRPFTEEDVDRVAVAIAKAANADYWTDEIAEWEGSEQWEREAYPDNYPGMAYEDREWYRKQARAALDAVTARHTKGDDR